MAGFKTDLFKTALCRISYAQGLHEPRTSRDGTKKGYGVTLIFPKDSIAELQKAVRECVEGEWGEKGIERFKKDLIKNPILPGDGKQAHDKEGNLRPGLGPDVVFIRPTAGLQYPPKVFGADTRPMDPAGVKSGWWGYAVLNCYTWHNPENGDGVSFGIDMWQHVREDELLGGGGGGNPDDFFKNEKVDTGDDGGDVSGGAGDMFA